MKIVNNMDSGMRRALVSSTQTGSLFISDGFKQKFNWFIVEENL